MTDRTPPVLALRALRDCGAIMTTDRNRAYLDLWNDCLVDFVDLRAGRRLYGIDKEPEYPGKWRKYRLTERGKALAATLGPLSQPA